jgi:hypothetical protein
MDGREAAAERLLRAEREYQAAVKGLRAETVQSRYRYAIARTELAAAMANAESASLNLLNQPATQLESVEQPNPATPHPGGT